jgi:hypothetical protein
MAPIRIVWGVRLNLTTRMRAIHSGSKCTYSYVIVGKAGPIPIIQVYFFFYCGCTSTWSAQSNYVKAPRFPIHPQARGWIGPALLHKVELYSLPGMPMIWPPFLYVVLPSTTILRRSHFCGKSKSPGACLMTLPSKKEFRQFRSLFIPSDMHNILK